MATITKMNTYEALSSLMQQYALELDSHANTEMETLLSYCLVGIDTDSEKFLATLFIKALKNKIETDLAPYSYASPKSRSYQKYQANQAYLD